MTDIDELRARMREAAVAVENASPAPRDPVFSDPQLEAMELFRALASPANVKALDAEITRLRDDLDRLTRERDGAYLTSQQAAQSYSNLMRVKDDIDAQRQAAEAALASYKEEVERLRAAMDREEAYLHRMIDASEENGGIMHGDLEGAFHRIRDKDSDDAERAEALAEETPHAG